MPSGKIFTLMGCILIVFSLFGLLMLLFPGLFAAPPAEVLATQSASETSGLSGLLDLSELSGQTKSILMSLAFAVFGMFSIHRGHRQALMLVAYQLYGQGMPAAIFAYLVKAEAARTGQSITSVLKNMKGLPGTESQDAE